MTNDAVERRWVSLQKPARERKNSDVIRGVERGSNEEQVPTMGLKKLEVPILAEKDLFQPPKCECWYIIVPPGSNEYCTQAGNDA